MMGGGIAAVIWKLGFVTRLDCAEAMSEGRGTKWDASTRYQFLN